MNSKFLLIWALATLSPWCRADELEDFLERIREPDRVNVAAQGPLVMKSRLLLMAEKIVLKGKIVTNGFGLTIVARTLEFVDGAEIVAFESAQVSNANQRTVQPAPDNAKRQQRGSNGEAGQSGFNGFAAHQSPGQIQIYAGVVIGAPHINGTGQQGGAGGQGQNGQNGGKGGMGSPAKTGGWGLWWNKGPGRGAPGGSGGTGGGGGAGGDGGAPVPIELHYGRYFKRDANNQLEELVLREDAEVILVSKGGTGGVGGIAGANGQSGAGGAGGNASRTIWKSSGSGKVGADGSANTSAGAQGAPGADNSAAPSSVVESTFNGIASASLRAEALVRAMNNARRADSLLRDYFQALETRSANDESFGNMIGVLNFRLQTLSKELSWSFQNQGVVPQSVQDYQKASNEVTAMLSRFTTALKETGPEQRLSPLQIQDFKVSATALIADSHLRGIEAMKDICREILKLKEKFSNVEERQNIALNAYRIYGPAELERWVFKKDQAGTRDELSLHNEIETSVAGRYPEYPLEIQKENDEERNAALNIGGLNVLP